MKSAIIIIAAVLLAGCQAYLPYMNRFEDTTRDFDADVQQDGEETTRNLDAVINEFAGHNAEQFMDETSKAQPRANNFEYKWADDKSKTDSRIMAIPPQEDIKFMVCLESLYLLAFTSGKKNAGSGGAQAIEVTVAGETKLIKLPDLDGNDYYRNKGDLWKLSFRDNLGFMGCVRRGDLDGIAIVARSKDGWNIDSVVSYMCAAPGRCWEATHNFDVFHWIDKNGDSEADQRLELTKVY